MQGVGTQKFLDFGGFPLDPDDIGLLRERASPREMYIYLRLFDQGGFIRMVVIASSIDSLKKAWAVSTSLEPPGDEMVIRLSDKVYQTFREPQVNPIDRGIAATATRILCMYYLKDLHKLRKVPKENIIGMILEYQDDQLTEYCYTQFALDVTQSKLH